MMSSNIDAQTRQITNPDVKRMCSRTPIDRYYVIVQAQEGDEMLRGVDLVISSPQNEQLKTARTDVNGSVALDLTYFFGRYETLNLQLVSETQTIKDTVLKKSDLDKPVTIVLQVSQDQSVGKLRQKTDSGKPTHARGIASRRKK